MKTCDVNTGFYTLPVPIFYILLRRDTDNGLIQRLYEGKKKFPNRYKHFIYFVKKVKKNQMLEIPFPNNAD